jgi:glycosyltransferase involved in cell wall biosynthesis
MKRNTKNLTPDFSNTPVSPERPAFHYTPIDRSIPPSVSIITPFYNTGSVFLETAQSVLQQSLQQWEWLIVNDGSDESESLQILDTFRHRDPRIKVIDLDINQGPSSARNSGMRRAQADLFFFLDSDDLIEPTALEKMAWYLESHPEFGFCKGFTIAFEEQEYLGDVGFESRKLFLSKNPVTITSMIRRKVVEAVEGFDEAMTTGVEDWDFWLRCAAREIWGGTIPEPLDWYRRCRDHSVRWSVWHSRGLKKMRRELKRRYPTVYAKGIPQIAPRVLQPYENIAINIPLSNLLTKDKKRLLLILPWMAMGGADRFNLALVTQLQKRNYEISIATTLPDNYAWYPEFARLTPDIFILPNFLLLNDYPRFLQYLIQSRRIDTVLLSNSKLGYEFLPYLRSHCPDTSFVDYCHMEEEYWENGGHPRRAVAYQELLDLNIVNSCHLKEWMIGRGAEPSRIEVCYINVDTDLLAPGPDLRTQVRAKLEISPGETVILYAGRLCEQKQPRVFAKVMHELHARGLEFTCLVAGDGRDRKWLTRYLNRHKLTDQVRMLGTVSNKHVRKLLGASDICFLPSKMEGISLSIFEAMAMGVVPVGADVGGQRELVTPECGTLINRSIDPEVETYADILENLIKSPELRKSMGNASRERVCSHFRIEQMGERMGSLLEHSRLLHQTHPRPAIGVSLGLEHALQAIEYTRVSRMSERLWKYQIIEASWRWLLSTLTSLSTRIPRPLQVIKDAVWIVGHKIKRRIPSQKNPGLLD